MCARVCVCVCVGGGITSRDVVSGILSGNFPALRGGFFKLAAYAPHRARMLRRLVLQRNAGPALISFAAYAFRSDVREAV